MRKWNIPQTWWSKFSLMPVTACFCLMFLPVLIYTFVIYIMIPLYINKKNIRYKKWLLLSLPDNIHSKIYYLLVFQHSHIVFPVAIKFKSDENTTWMISWIPQPKELIVFFCFQWYCTMILLSKLYYSFYQCKIINNY